MESELRTLEPALHELRERIASREAKVGVIGLGAVGLAVARAAHAAGHPVLGHDIDEGLIARLGEGTCPHPHMASEETTALMESERFEVTGDSTAIAAKLPDTTGKRATVFLLYLNDETFLSTAGETLAEELRTVRAEGSSVQVIMVHENEWEKGGCEFNDFFGTTPQELINDGIYRSACTLNRRND